jgi:hypothetical protein
VPRTNHFFAKGKCPLHLPSSAVRSSEPVYEDKHGNSRCSTHVKIKTLQEFSGRRSTFVVAREVGTGMRLRCEVFIDKVHRLQLVQNTHLIYLESYAEATMQVGSPPPPPTPWSSPHAGSACLRHAPRNTHRVSVPAAAPVESCRASPPHRPREDALAHPADTSRSNRAAALGLLSRRRLSKPSRWSTREA